MICFLGGGLAILAAIVCIAHIVSTTGAVSGIVYGAAGISIAAVGLFGFGKVGSPLQHQYSVRELSDDLPAP
jgi:hypothetical protein